jgi:hypothetical protein
MLRTLLRPLELVLMQLLLRTGPRRETQGLLLSCSSVGADCSEFFGKCETALDLIRTYAPHRFSRLLRDVRVVGLTSRGSSYYEPRLRTVFLDVGVVQRDSTHMALTLIHEGVHARLYRAGIRNYAKDPGRHEQLCLRQEIAFASRLPNSEALVTQLKSASANPWWNEAGRRAQIQRFVGRHGLPEWLERFLIRFGAR